MIRTAAAAARILAGLPWEVGREFWIAGSNVYLYIVLEWDARHRRGRRRW